MILMAFGTFVLFLEGAAWAKGSPYAPYAFFAILVFTIAASVTGVYIFEATERIVVVNFFRFHSLHVSDVERVYFDDNVLGWTNLYLELDDRRIGCFALDGPKFGGPREAERSGQSAPLAAELRRFVDRHKATDPSD